MLSQPVQNRSRRTLEAIFEAAESLLQDRDFEAISIAEIILKAGCSTGSFYARFSGKDALLPELYARYHADLPERFARLRASLNSGSPCLAEACERIVEAFSAVFEGRKNLMRAMILYVRTRPGQVRTLSGERASLHKQMIELLRPFHQDIRHPDPEAALRAGLFFVATAIREAVLFPDAPFAAATGQSIDQMKRAASDMLFSYLTLKTET